MTSPQPRRVLTGTVVRIVDIWHNPADQLDCEDDDPVHAWVTVPAWSARRALLVQGTQFLRAATADDPGTIVGSLEALRGKRFLADVPEPDWQPEPGERIELRDLRKAPALPAGWLEHSQGISHLGPA